MTTKKIALAPNAVRDFRLTEWETNRVKAWSKKDGKGNICPFGSIVPCTSGDTQLRKCCRRLFP